jgi:hypothetical protein
VKHDVHIKIHASPISSIRCVLQGFYQIPNPINHISLVDASINNTIMHNVEISIEGDNLLVSNKTSLDCIDQCTMKIRKADGSNICVCKLSPSLLLKVLSIWIACGHYRIKIRKLKVKSNLIADADVVITFKVLGPKNQTKVWPNG